MSHKWLVCFALLLSTLLFPVAALSIEIDPLEMAEFRSMIDALHEKQEALEPRDMLSVEVYQYALRDPEFYVLMEKDVLIKLEQLGRALERRKSQFSKEESEKYEGAVDYRLARLIEKELDAMTEEEVSALDQRLQHDWQSMCDALVRDDIEKAAGYFHKKTRDSYRHNFELIPKERLSEFANGMREIYFEKHRSFEMIYDLRKRRNGQVLSFQMTFEKEIRGDWKIHGF